MKPRQVYIVVLFAILVFSCKKNTGSMPPTQPPPVATLLKDIVIQTFPSPYYHFEYAATGRITKFSFASGFNMYDVVYKGNNIDEMKNNTMVNKDRLQYVYDNTGKVAIIKYVDEGGVMFRRASLAYDGQQLKEIEWQQKQGTAFVIERTITFTYLPDGNLQQFTDHRPAINGQPQETFIQQFEQYDNKINVDAFSLIHDGFDHLVLLPGVQLQKNNPLEIIRTGDGVNYTIDYGYTYNNENKPLKKTGNVIFTSGPNAGQKFQSVTTYTYY